MPMLKPVCDCGLIDTHTHWVPSSFPAYVGGRKGVAWPSIAPAESSCQRHVMIQDKVYRTIPTSCFDFDERARNMAQTDPAIPVFLLSLKAAGSGLNLTAASYVVLFDPWWNPAVEAQAIDRTHRIGQKNQVMAYRLIARNTVEEKIRALQKEKAALAAAVVQEESLATVLDLASLRAILA